MAIFFIYLLFLIAIHFFKSWFADISVTSKGSRYRKRIKKGIALFDIIVLSPNLNPNSLNDNRQLEDLEGFLLFSNNA